MIQKLLTGAALIALISAPVLVPGVAAAGSDDGHKAGKGGAASNNAPQYGLTQTQPNQADKKDHKHPHKPGKHPLRHDGDDDGPES